MHTLNYKKILPSVLMLVAGISTAEAAVTEYILSNHPAGSAQPPQYGLRLDGLLTGNASDEFTFDFNHTGTNMSSDMRLRYDDSTQRIRIFGTAFGGLDSGNSYDPLNSGFWNIDFTYNVNVTEDAVSAPDFGLTVNPESRNPFQNTGTIEFLSASTGSLTQGQTFSLADEDGGNGHSFKFNNHDDHRLNNTGLSGPNTFVGWGWVNHNDDPNTFSENNIQFSDWIFTGVDNGTVSAIPEPSNWVLFALPGALLAFYSRRRTRK